MSIIKSITLTKDRDPRRCANHTTASVEFSAEKFSVALQTDDEVYRFGPPGGEYEEHMRRFQIEEVARQITGSIQREIAEALTRLDSVVRNGEAITLRVAR